MIRFSIPIPDSQALDSRFQIFQIRFSISDSDSDSQGDDSE